MRLSKNVLESFTNDLTKKWVKVDMAYNLIGSKPHAKLGSWMFQIYRLADRFTGRISRWTHRRFTDEIIGFSGFKDRLTPRVSHAEWTWDVYSISSFLSRIDLVVIFMGFSVRRRRKGGVRTCGGCGGCGCCWLVVVELILMLSLGLLDLYTNSSAIIASVAISPMAVLHSVCNGG